jgi:hypothetical protein
MADGIFKSEDIELVVRVLNDPECPAHIRSITTEHDHQQAVLDHARRLLNQAGDRQREIEGRLLKACQEYVREKEKGD